MKMIISIFIFIGATVISAGMWLIMFLTSLVLFPFDKDRRIAHIQAIWWAEGIMAIIPWKITVKGLENIQNDKAYVIVANHRSMMDILVMYKIRHQFKWVAKEELFKVPFMGWMMSICKYVELKRGKFSSIKRTYRTASDWLRRGISVIFFPEGTRSESDSMKDFQNGPFKIAIKEKMKILPICIEGTSNILQKGSWIMEPGVKCSLTVLPPIDTADFKPGDFERLRDITRSAIESVLTLTKI
jgi:1-acyl-sn-glycerol-3-phosphate acyltransferase